jgi:hypothetical protein
MGRLRPAIAAAGAATSMAVLLAPATAGAHFILEAPASWAEQDNLGSPQKTAPCGQADPQAAVPTNAVTDVHAGDTITVTIDEAVYHPGHYRVVLSTTGQAGLGPDPETTLPGTCMDLAVEDPPVFPVIADGVLPHTHAFTGPQSFQVALPADVTCTNCTLQVLEFMQADVGASGNCFYHHCADLRIAAPGADAGVDDGGRDAAGVSPVEGGGCGCGLGGRRAPGGGMLVVVGWMLRRARRERPPAPEDP